ncbi:hypothetical protein HEK131_47070 [Streptomyces seoulensis]|nr:hypothetical protein HEK131_47070 [Streptomyces seoulensis]
MGAKGGTPGPVGAIGGGGTAGPVGWGGTVGPACGPKPTAGIAAMVA